MSFSRSTCVRLPTGKYAADVVQVWIKHEPRLSPRQKEHATPRQPPGHTAWLFAVFPRRCVFVDGSALIGDRLASTMEACASTCLVVVGVCVQRSDASVGRRLHARGTLTSPSPENACGVGWLAGKGIPFVEPSFAKLKIDSDGCVHGVATLLPKCVVMRHCCGLQRPFRNYRYRRRGFCFHTQWSCG